jgi:hypothetical protein
VNAATSPLLLLPPEIRCRICDYAFSDCVVRVRDGRIKVCHSSQACESRLSQRRDQRVIFGPRAGVGVGSLGYDFRSLGWPEGCRTHASSRVPVHLLQVSRQIYHEAVLKPFVQKTFDFDSFPDTFLAKLVPTQARAIVRTRFMCSSDLFLNIAKGARSHLKGLNHVEIHLGIALLILPPQPLDEVTESVQGPTFDWLSGIGLESLRFVVGMEELAPSEALKSSISKLVQGREDEILSK